jgi:hypothetical protein
VGLAVGLSIGEPERRIRRFQIKYRTEMTISIGMVELTMPPIIAGRSVSSKTMDARPSATNQCH